MDSDLDFSVDVTVPGLSPLYPDVACRPDLKICVMTTGESEVSYFEHFALTSHACLPKFVMRSMPLHPRPRFSSHLYLTSG